MRAKLLILISGVLCFLCGILYAEEASSDQEVIAVYRYRAITKSEIDSMRMSAGEAADSSSGREYKFWVKMLELIKLRYLKNNSVEITEDDVENERKRLLERDFGKELIKRENFQKEVDKDQKIIAALRMFRLDPKQGDSMYEDSLRDIISRNEWKTYKKYYNTDHGIKLLQDSVDNRLLNISNFEASNKAMMKYYWNYARKNIIETLFKEALVNNYERYSEVIKGEMQKLKYQGGGYLDYNKISTWAAEIVEADDLYVSSERKKRIYENIDRIENPELYIPENKSSDAAPKAVNVVQKDQSTVREVSDRFGLTSQSDSLFADNKVNRSKIEVPDHRSRAIAANKKTEEPRVAESYRQMPPPVETRDGSSLNESDYYFYGAILIVASAIGIFLKTRKKS